MTPTSIDELQQVLDATERLVAGIRREQWSAPTPCTDWNVRQLINHLVTGNRIVADILRDEASFVVELPHLRALDHLGDNPTAAYRDAKQTLLMAFRQPGIMADVFSLPLGPVAGLLALHMCVIEALVHGWDLSRATGQTLDYPHDLAARELQLVRRRPVDSSCSWPGRPFAPPQPVADDAPVIDKLVAWLGRPIKPTVAEA